MVVGPANLRPIFRGSVQSGAGATGSGGALRIVLESADHPGLIGLDRHRESTGCGPVRFERQLDWGLGPGLGFLPRTAQRLHLAGGNGWRECA